MVADGPQGVRRGFLVELPRSTPHSLHSVASGSRQLVDMADGQAGSQQAEHKEGLRTGLVLDVIGDGVRQEVLELEVDLQKPTVMCCHVVKTSNAYHCRLAA